MADDDRWRKDQQRSGYRDEDRDRGRNERGSGDYGRGGYRGEFRGGGYGAGGDYRGSGSAGYGGDYGRDYGDYREGRYGGEYRGGSSGYEGGGGGYERDYGYGGAYREGRYTGAGYGGERYGRGGYGRDYGDYGRRGEERGFWNRASDEVSSWFGDEDAERRRRMDEMRAGQHRGRGPKGYSRSDDRIRDDVCDRLTDDPQVDASEIDVTVSNGEAILSGTVDSREAKRRAEDCAERVSGVKNVQNNLRVQTQGRTGTTGQETTSAATTIGARR